MVRRDRAVLHSAHRVGLSVSRLLGVSRQDGDRAPRGRRSPSARRTAKFITDCRPASELNQGHRIALPLGIIANSLIANRGRFAIKEFAIMPKGGALRWPWA